MGNARTGRVMPKVYPIVDMVWPMAVIETRGLTKSYGSVTALNSLDITVSGGITGLVGANGAGKSTLLRALAGLHRPSAGRVQFEGHDITGMCAEKIVRNGLSLVPEGRQVFAELSVRDNLLLGAYHRRRTSGVADTIEEIFTLFPRLRERTRQLAGTLSGGEQQMLALGRALMAEPHLLLLDEPSLGLAPLAVREVFDRIALLAQTGTTVLLVEQNTRAALRVASRGYVLNRGKIVTAGAREDLLKDPKVEAAYLGRGFEDLPPHGREA